MIRLALFPFLMFAIPAVIVSVWSSWRGAATAAPALLAWSALILMIANQTWWVGRAFPSPLRNWSAGRTFLVWFLLAGPVSMILGAPSPSNLGFWSMLVLTMILCWIIGALFTGEPERLLRACAWTWLAYLAWYFTLAIKHLERHPYERNGMFAVGLGAGLASAWAIRWIPGRVFMLALGMGFALLTQQRTGLVAATGCVLWALFWILVRRMRRWRGLVLPALVLMVLILIPFLSAISDWINGLLLLDDPVRGLGSGFTGRWQIWALALVRFLESPWFGHGPMSNEYIIYEVIRGPRTAHNGVLALLVDYGIFGAIPALLLFLLALRRGMRLFWSSGELAWLGWSSVIVFILLYSLGEKYWFNFGNQTSLMGLAALGLLFERSERGTAHGAPDEEG